MSWLLYASAAVIAYKLLSYDKSNDTSKPARKRSASGDKSTASAGENGGSQARRRSSISPQQARKLLEIEADADEASMRRAYQNKVRQYHPDVVANAAPEIRALAEQRTKELNAAYECLKRLH